MKNLKKVLAFVLAFTMVLGFAVSASVFPDVEENASYAEAVTILNSLKIMVGDDNGKFNPDDTITRAEVTAVIVRMTGLEAAANGAKGATAFTDVAADHWATGYINLAYQSGIINGYGDGTFGPSDPVTHEQAIKMIVAALGYTPKALNNGGYPSGYLVIASQKGVTTGVSGSAGEPAKRSAVARAVFNALTVEIMKQTGFVKGQEEYTEDTDETLLKDALKVDKYQGVVRDTYLSIGADSDDDRIIIGVDYLNDENVTDYNETFVEGNVDAVALFGQTVVAYGAEDEDTGDLTLLAIAAKSGKNASVTVDYSQIDKFDENVIEYYAKDSDTRTTKLDLATGANALKCYYNGRSDETEVLGWLGDPTTGSVKLIDNDNDDEYEYVLVSQFTSHAVVGDIDTTTSTLEGKNNADIDIDIEDENVITRFFATDGSAIEFEDIEVGDVISIMKSTDEALVMAYISKEVVEGKVTEEKPDANNDKGYTIGDKEYKIALDGDGSPAISLAVGNEGKFFLNVEGRIVAKDASIITGGNYAFMYKAGVTTGVGGTEVEVRFLTIAGEWVTAKLASKVMVYEDTNDGTSTPSYPTGTATTSDLGICTVTKAGSDYTVTAIPQVFQYSLNSADKINKIYVVGNDNQSDDDSIFSRDASATEGFYKESLGKIGGVYFDEDTKVFSVPAKDVDFEDIDEADIAVTTAKALFKADNAYTVEAYDIDGTSPAVMLAYGAKADIAEETKLFVITKITESNNDNGVKVRKLYGYQMGKETSAVEQEDGMVVTDRYKEPTSVSVGDAVIFSLNAANELDNVKVLMSAEEAFENIEGDVSLYEEDDELYTQDIFGFAASKPRTGQLEIAGDAFDDLTTEDIVETITEKLTASDTTVYEINLNRAVDKDGNFTSVPASAVTAASYTKIIKGENADDGDDAHWIYVRKYDDTVVDAIIYRFVYSEDK